MRNVADAFEMKKIDGGSIETCGIPSMVLMERAALAVTEELRKRYPEPVQVLVIAGVGNNGADGLAAARILAESDYPARVLYLGNADKATTEWKHQRDILEQIGIPVERSGNPEAIVWKEYPVIIDAIFGIGLAREVGGVFRQMIEAMNRADSFVISVDTPSGISSNTGCAMGIAVKADLTITFGCEKLGLLLYPGADYAGELVVRQVGFPKLAVERAQCSARRVEESDVMALPKRPAWSNKGTFGKILIFAGSRNMAGAAYYAAAASMAMGSGLVRILTVEENREILQTVIPEAVLSTYDPENPDLDQIRNILAWADVLAAGPGLSTDPRIAAVLACVLEEFCGPKVLDADALNLLAVNPEWKDYLGGECVLTPHPGELSRLTGMTIAEIRADFPAAARSAADMYGCTVICKDAASLIASPGKPLVVNTTGNSGMAAGGSGDVLTGITASLLFDLHDAYLAAAYGAYLHGTAGDLARKTIGTHAMGPKDLIRGIGEFWMRHE